MRGTEIQLQSALTLTLAARAALVASAGLPIGAA